MAEEKKKLNKLYEKLTKIPIHIVFIIVASIEALLFAFLIPIDQTPDELHHIALIHEELGITKYNQDIDTFFNSLGVTEILGNNGNKLDSDTYYDLSMHYSEKLSISDMHPNYFLLRHLPALPGLLIGMFLNLPIFVCFTLAEITSIIFYIMCGFFTLKKAPLKKEMFFFILLMPMMLQQASSIGYDNIVNCVSLLLIAYILDIYYNEKELNWKRLVFILVATALIAVTKPPYAFILFLVLLIKKDKWDIGIRRFKIKNLKAYQIAIIIAVILAVIGVEFYLHRHATIMKLLITTVMAPGEIVRLIYNSWRDLGYFYLKSLVGNFGGLDSEVHFLYIVLFFVMMTYMNGTNFTDITIRKKDRAIYLGLSVVIISLIYIALLSWTYQVWDYTIDTSWDVMVEYNKSLTSIDGVQGRYFIPILPLILLAFSGNKKDGKGQYAVKMALFYIISIIHVGVVLSTRYWG